MSKIHIRSYLDQNAPQFDGIDRKALIKFFTAHFKDEPYIVQHPVTIVTDANSKTLQITLNEPPKFIEGHLIQLKETENTVFQSTSYRVIKIEANTLTVTVSNFDEVEYPVSENSLNMKVQLAAFDWEVCFSSANQFSMRSTNPKSSRNVFTLKTNNFTAAETEPSGSATSIKYSTASPVYVSRSIVTNTGELIEDLTQTAHNMYTGDNTTKQTLYFVWNCYSHSYSTCYGGNVPWFLVADDKFFYLIVGSYSNSAANSVNSDNRNFHRNPDYGVMRHTYMFGDPDFLGDPDFVDHDGTVLQASWNSNWDSSGAFYQSRFTDRINSGIAIGSKSTGNLYFIRDFETSVVQSVSNDIIAASLYSVFNSANTIGGGSGFSYPNKPTGGFLNFPIYLAKYVSGTNGGGYYRSALPFALNTPITLSNLMGSNWPSIDYNLFKSSTGQLLLPIITSASTSAVNNIALFELD